MVITATELKGNLGKYLELADREDIYVTKNGRQIAKLTNTRSDRKREVQEIFDAFDALELNDLPSREEARSERLGIA